MIWFEKDKVHDCFPRVEVIEKRKADLNIFFDFEITINNTQDKSKLIYQLAQFKKLIDYRFIEFLPKGKYKAFLNKNNVSLPICLEFNNEINIFIMPIKVKND